MADKTIGVFAYNFPHLKTQDGLFYLLAHGYKIGHIFAADKVPLNFYQSTIRTTPRIERLIHPSLIAKQFNIPYSIVAHNQSAPFIKSLNLDLGIILGARILSKAVIDAFNIGIINIHPGILPINRGLDNIKWAILNNQPQGNTAHFIDQNIDRGLFLGKNIINVYPDDSLVDIQIRLNYAGLDLLIEVLDNFGYLVPQQMLKYPLRRAIPEDLELKMLSHFDEYKRTYNSLK